MPSMATDAGQLLSELEVALAEQGCWSANKVRRFASIIRRRAASTARGPVPTRSPL